MECSDSEEEIFLGAVGSGKGTVWLSNVNLQGKEVQFKMDTGAEFTVISDKLYHTLNAGKLEKASRNLFGPAHQLLAVIGQFDGIMQWGKHTIFIWSRAYTAIYLGYQQLTLYKRRVDTTMERQTCEVVSTIREQYPKVFKGLGTFGEDYTVQMKKDAHPHALYTPRRVPFALRNAVQE